MSSDKTSRTPAVGRGTLTLQDQGASVEATTVEVDAIDVRLPCRVFKARYKVAQSGKFSLTTEFLLRLLLTVGDMHDREVGNFFGFDIDEADHAIGAAVGQGYVDQLSGGRLRLSDAGRAAFHLGGGKPHVYEIDEREDSFSLDALSFRPITIGRQDDFDLTLPELPLLDATAMASSSESAAVSFKRHFRDLGLGKRTEGDNARQLYSLDEVRPLRRAECVLPISVTVRNVGAAAEPDLSPWRTAFDTDQRATIVSSAVELLASIQGPPAASTVLAAQVVQDLAPDVARGLVSSSGVEGARYFRLAAKQSGEIQSNRRTVRTVGTLWSVGTLNKLASAVSLGEREGRPPARIAIWLVPALPGWGASRRLPHLLHGLFKDQDEEVDAAGVRTVALCPPVSRNVERRLGETADDVLSLRRDVVPAALELLLVPGRLAAALVHTPLDARGYPVALGIVSVDDDVVGRAAAYLHALLDGFGNVSPGGNADTYQVASDVARLLASSPVTN
jgi:hypothetical protein